MVDTRFYKNNGPFTLAKVVEVTGAKLLDEAQSDVLIEGLASMESACDKEVCFFFDKKSKAKASNINARACITTDELKDLIPDNVIVLVCENPKVAFLKLNEAMYTINAPKNGVSPSAQIASSAKIGANVSIGANVVIGENVMIGDNCQIKANVVIDDSCIIGDNCQIDVGAHISYCIMGNNCRIFSGARIGQDGFGFMFEAGRHKRIPQLGRIIIGNDVEIGCNACVDRGALDDTIVADGCRIDNLVQVAHNDIIGRGCILVSQVGVAGSTKIGDYSVLGGQVGVADHITIGSQVQIGAQSGVMSNIADGEVVMGYPTVPIKQFMKQSIYLKKAVTK